MATRFAFTVAGVAFAVAWLAVVVAGLAFGVTRFMFVMNRFAFAVTRFAVLLMLVVFAFITTSLDLDLARVVRMVAVVLLTATQSDHAAAVCPLGLAVVVPVLLMAVRLDFINAEVYRLFAERLGERGDTSVGVDLDVLGGLGGVGGR